MNQSTRSGKWRAARYPARPLGRSTRDLLNTLHHISSKGAGFRSIADTWADTTTAHGRLLVTMLAGIAEFERELIKARTGEGRKRARDRGVQFGRPMKLTPHQRREALERLEAGETQADIARSYDVDATTIGRLLKRAEVVHHLPGRVQQAFHRAMRRE
jgi:DNA invertase Pin-like site-specific DNA recombinase